MFFDCYAFFVAKNFLNPVLPNLKGYNTYVLC